MRAAIAITLFPVVAALVAVAEPAVTVAQDKKGEMKAKVDPKALKPDEATLKTIKEKTEELRKAIAVLKEKKVADEVLVDVEVCLKAAEWIVRHNEWFTADGGKQTLTALGLGLDRAKLAADGKAPWKEVNGKWVVRGYRSKVDGSIQPYAMILPDGYGKPAPNDFSDERGKRYRMDVVLHGRDAALTEVKFVAGHEGRAAPKGLDYVLVAVYGRGNNAYRWAGETDVFEAMEAGDEAARKWVRIGDEKRKGWIQAIDGTRTVLRGFSMGGAGTWHIGLHHPNEFCVIGPGAGFTTTRGYVGNLPKELPEYVEKCLHIYDAVDYAENVFHVPVVAYSGEKDAQKKAADNIENALKNFKESVKFTHLVAPGLEHQMPKEWQDKAEAEYRKYADKQRKYSPDRVRFVTYTPKYGKCGWVQIDALEATYSRALVEAEIETLTTHTVTTTNVRQLTLYGLTDLKEVGRLRLDGQELMVQPNKRLRWRFEKQDGKWVPLADEPAAPIKSAQLCGPIDDAFMGPFVVIGPTDGKYPASALKQFAALWDKYFRGTLPVLDPKEAETANDKHLVLFGDPESNPLIAKVLPKLPITWTKDKLVVNGVEYDSKTHVPVLIYPSPLNPGKYVVLNSGHTFKEADLKGTNALLYPRLGDWAVIKPTPTERDPAAYEVVAAGLFDENWQFPKKK
jgi:hypothetical protein